MIRGMLPLLNGIRSEKKAIIPNNMKVLEGIIGMFCI
jgi:hypothetical protein